MHSKPTYKLMLLAPYLIAACSSGAQVPQPAPDATSDAGVEPTSVPAPPPEAPTHEEEPVKPERMDWDPADAHATSLLLIRAEKRPATTIEALARMPLPWAKAWAGFLLVATRPQDQDAATRALALQEEARIGMGKDPEQRKATTLTPADALLEVRFVGEDTPDSREVPCWIAHRWPEAWVSAFDAWHGSSRDAYLPQCDPPLDKDWATAHSKTADLLLGPVNGFCGTLGYAERRSAFVMPFRAWYLPRTVLAEVEKRRGYRTESRTELLEALHGDLQARDRYVAAVQPTAAWRRRLSSHLRAQGLSRKETADVIDATEATIESCMISAELRCGRAEVGE